MTDLENFLIKLNKNYQILKEREAKYATAAPLDLLNQIEEYEQAIEYTQQAIHQDIPLDELQAEFEGLDLQIKAVIFVPQEPPRKPFTGQNPYRGLRKFTEDDADYFFGRNTAIQSLLDIVQNLIGTPTSPEAPNFIAALGASGSGKSSLVRAGLIPALWEGQVAGSEQWPIKVMLPGPHPLDALAESFLGQVERGLPAIRRELDEGEKALHYLMTEALAGKPDEPFFVLVIDQFEEIFTLCEDEAERQLFLGQLLHAAERMRGRGLIIITMRADFYAKVAADRRLAAVITLNQMLVSPLTEKELREAILLPAETVGLELEKALVETLIRDTFEAPGTLPLLQYALLELFRRRDGNLLTLDAYRKIGGVQGSIAHRADKIMSDLTPDQQQIAKRIFMRLIRLGEGTADTRRRASFNEVLTNMSQTAEYEAIVQTLANANLLVTNHDLRSNQIVLDVAHETLIRKWPALRNWLDENREALRIQSRLAEAAVEWTENNLDVGYLYRGARLAEAEEWAETHSDNLNELERTFLVASLDERERVARENEAQRQRELEAARKLAKEAEARRQAEAEQARQAEARVREQTRATKRIRLVAIGLAVVFLIALGAMIWAISQQQVARHQSHISLAKSLAALASQVTNDHELTTLLGVEAFETNREAQGDAQWLIDSVLRDRLAKPYFSNILHGHEARILSVAFSRGGEMLASSGDDPAILLWDLSKREVPFRGELTGHTDRVWSVAFSPDGEMLASGSTDQTVRLWDLNQPRAAPQILLGHSGSVRSVTYSPDGQLLASGGDDQTIRLWDLSQPEADPTVLHGHTASVRSVAFSPDGEMLASSGDDQTIRLWDLNQPEVPPQTLRGHTGPVWSAAFSPDGEMLASGGGDQTVRLWDLSQPGAAPTILHGHETTVVSVAFSPDGEMLASGSTDQTVRLWDLRQPEVSFHGELSGHTDRVWSVAFSPDGGMLASSGDDRTVRLWDLNQPKAAPQILLGHSGSVRFVTYSPDGQLLASGSNDQTVRLWDLNQPEVAPRVLDDHTEPVLSVAYSPDGQLLASGSNDQTVRLWDLNQPRAAPQILRGHFGSVRSVAFSPDGEMLASSGDDQTVRLWDLSHPGAAPTILHRHTASVRSLAFSPDGEMLASSGDDQTIRLWDLSQPEVAPQTLRGHTGPVWSVAFSPDGQLLASGGDDQTVRLWDLSQPGAAPQMLLNHEDPIWSIAFSPDGQLLASGSNDQTIRLWDLRQPEAAPRVLRGHTDSVLSVAFSPDGEMLASSGDDRTIRLWIASLGELAELGCQQVRRNLSQAEWNQYFSGKSYHRTCPDLPPGTVID